MKFADMLRAYQRLTRPTQPTPDQQRANQTPAPRKPSGPVLMTYDGLPFATFRTFDLACIARETIGRAIREIDHDSEDRYRYKIAEDEEGNPLPCDPPAYGKDIEIHA